MEKYFNKFNENNDNFNLNDYTDGYCFVYIQGNDADIEKYYDLVRMSKDDKFILYPERALTLIDKVTYRPYVKSIVTEEPYIIGVYDRKKVFILRDGEWQKSDMQTYGASVDAISYNILGLTSSINYRVLGGADEWLNKVKNNTQYR
jgi:hypothetical protein